jgi:hypothetical protein
MFKQFVMLVGIILVASSVTSYANPDAIVIPNGDLRIKGPGSGLVFPDGSIQYKAIDVNTCYSNAQIDGLVASFNTLISLQPSTSLFVNANGTTTNLSWTPVAQAVSYNVYWGTGSGITKSNQKISQLSGTTYQHTALTRGTVYFYAVSANYISGEGPLSPEVFIQVPYAQTNPIREMEPNNTTVNATPIFIGGGAFRGQLSSGFSSCSDLGDFDYYRFESMGGLVKFSITTDLSNSTSGLIKATIGSQDGVTVLSSITVNSTTGNTPQLLVANTLPGVYYIMFSSKYTCDSSGGGSYNYSFMNDYIVTPSYTY